MLPAHKINTTQCKYMYAIPDENQYIAALQVIVKIRTFEECMQTEGSFPYRECACFIYNSTVCSDLKSPWVESFSIPGHCDIYLNVSMHVPEKSVEKSQRPAFPLHCVEGSVGLIPDWCFQHRMLRSAAWNRTLAGWDHLLQQSCIPLPLCQCIPLLSWLLGVQSAIPVLWPHSSRHRTEIRSYHHPQNRNTESFIFLYKPWRIYVGGTPHMNMLL